MDGTVVLDMVRQTPARSTQICAAVVPFAANITLFARWCCVRTGIVAVRRQSCAHFRRCSLRIVACLRCLACARAILRIAAAHLFCCCSLPRVLTRALAPAFHAHPTLRDSSSCLGITFAITRVAVFLALRVAARYILLHRGAADANASGKGTFSTGYGGCTSA